MEHRNNLDLIETKLIELRENTDNMESFSDVVVEVAKLYSRYEKALTYISELETYINETGGIG